MANLPEQSVWTDGIYQLEEDDPVRGGLEGVSNAQARQLACRTAALKEMAEREASALEGLAAEAGSRLNALEGRGGPVAARDFGTETPAQEALTAHACESIWGAGGAFAWSEGDPAASTYAVGGVVHAAAEIFNSTWVRNTYNGTNHRIVLTNTPDTSPPVFSWEDVGYDTVGVATEALAGLVKSGGDIEVNPVTGGVAVKNADKLDGQEGSYYQNAGNLNAGTLPAARLPYSQLYIVTPKRSFGTEANFSTYQESYAVNIADLRRIDVIQYNNPGVSSGYFNFKIVFNNSGVSIDSNALYEKTIILDLRPATANIRPTRWTAAPNRESGRAYSLEEAVTASLSSGSPLVISNLVNKGIPNHIYGGKVNLYSRFGVYDAFSYAAARAGDTASVVDSNTSRQVSVLQAKFRETVSRMSLLSSMMLKVEATWSPLLNVIWLDLTPYYFTSQGGDW